MKLDPHKLVSSNLVAYTGDVSLIEHGGTFYDYSQWEDNGYASAIRVTPLDDNPDGGLVVVVERITINKPADMKPALDCCGVTLDPDCPHNTHYEIEACLAYGHYEPDESDWREEQMKVFIWADRGERVKDFTDYCRIHDIPLANVSHYTKQTRDYVSGLVRDLYEGH